VGGSSVGVCELILISLCSGGVW